MPMTLRPALVAAFALVALPAFADVRVTDAWVRATVTGQRTTAAFMKLTPTADATLIGAASPAAAVVEIHEMKLDAGVMQMRRIERLPLQAGKTVELTPSGYHVMLMGLRAPVSDGGAIPITLTFEDRAGKRTSVEVKAAARPLTAPAPAKH
jgi:copper(I)-binding protein